MKNNQRDVIYFKRFITSNLCHQGLWTENNRDKYCKNYTRPLIANVSTQTECQGLCEADSKCVGISYSHKPEKNNYCFLCQDSVLSNANNSFGFYKKKGNFGSVLGQQLLMNIIQSLCLFDDSSTIYTLQMLASLTLAILVAYV